MSAGAYFKYAPAHIGLQRDNSGWPCGGPVDLEMRHVQEHASSMLLHVLVCKGLTLNKTILSLDKYDFNIDFAFEE